MTGTAITRNITLAVDDEILSRYRAVASRNKSSVNSMIRKHMEEVVGATDEEQRAAIARMLARAKATPLAIHAPPLRREELYDREEG